MSHVRIICADCRVDGEPLKHDSTCDDCTADWVARHGVEYPSHVIELRPFFNIDPFMPHRATQRLTRKASGW